LTKLKVDTLSTAF